MKEFIEAGCIQAEGATVTCAELYRAYNNWADEQELPQQDRFSRRSCCLAMARQGFRTAKGSGGVRFWCGLRLRSVADDTPLSHSLCHS